VTVVDDLHTDPPMTMARAQAVHRWVLPVASIMFSLLAVLATANALAWDRPITDWVVNSRTPMLDGFFRRVSFLGSTRVVLVVAALAALASFRRCPRLAMAIVVIALARPLIEFGLKDLIGRDRPVGDQLVRGRGPSFPSGHPLATAASWGLLPLVVALYTGRRLLWWTVAVSVWVLAVLVAISRVWLGVHWTSDVVASLALAVLGVFGAERFISATHGCQGCARSAVPVGADAQPISVRETTSARS
jgi:undecaprenyl-diphosphatase